MRRKWIVGVLSALLLLVVSGFTVMAQEPTAVPEYDPACAIQFMEAYVSGWEYNHRGSEGVIDVVAAAQVARAAYQAFAAVKVDCKNTFGGFKLALLRSLHGDYPPEDLARLLQFISESIGQVDYNDCSYQVATRFLQRVDWGDTSAIQAGRTMSEIFRTVRNVIPNGACDGTFAIIQEILSEIEDVPPDSGLVSTLYQTVGEATGGHYVSESSCNYTLAKTFLDKVEWDGLTSAAIVQLVGDTFKTTYKISGDYSCDSDPALAITAMLLDDTYRFKPDASVIQSTYDAALGELVVTPVPEETPIVN